MAERGRGKENERDLKLAISKTLFTGHIGHLSKEVCFITQEVNGK